MIHERFTSSDVKAGTNRISSRSIPYVLHEILIPKVAFMRTLEIVVLTNYTFIELLINNK